MARFFHKRYEERAPEFGYKTRPETAVPWEDLPAENRNLMIAVCEDILIILDDMQQAKDKMFEKQ